MRRECGSTRSQTSPATGQESRHNLKYWTRQPYLGFGVDAHSMLHQRSEWPAKQCGFASPDSLEEYVAGGPPKKTPVSAQAALEETFFLGLRLNRGVDLKNVATEFGEAATGRFLGHDFGMCGIRDCWNAKAM